MTPIESMARAMSPLKFNDIRDANNEIGRLLIALAEAERERDELQAYLTDAQQQIGKARGERDENFQNYVDANEARISAEKVNGELIAVIRKALDTHDLTALRVRVMQYQQDALKEMMKEAQRLDLP